MGILKTHSKWPSDSSEYTFLARAFLRIGRALSPELWRPNLLNQPIPGVPKDWKEGDYSSSWMS